MDKGHTIEDETLIANRLHALERLPMLLKAMGLSRALDGISYDDLQGQAQRGNLHDIPDHMLRLHGNIGTKRDITHVRYLLPIIARLEKVGLSAETHVVQDGKYKGWVTMLLDVSGDDFIDRFDRLTAAEIAREHGSVVDSLMNILLHGHGADRQKPVKSRDGLADLMDIATPEDAAKIAGQAIGVILDVLEHTKGAGLKEIALGHARTGREKG